MTILTLNAGSSSIKFAVFLDFAASPELSGQVECIGSSHAEARFRSSEGESREMLEGNDHAAAIAAIIKFIGSAIESPLDAIGHRVVHGGERFRATERIDAAKLEEIRALNPLAPLHNPASLAGIEACLEHFPECPQYAIFDTAFHANIPETHFRYAVPQEWYTEHQVRRYGFHGISHSFIAAEAIREFDIDPQRNRILIAHLGNGCSATAVVDGRSRDTSMGFTPLEGLVMGTRSGSIDPGIHAHIVRETGMSIEEVTETLNKQSGLLALSGASDMRELREAVDRGEPASRLALEVFVHRLVKELAALTASLGGLPHALVFTGGIGENNPQLRREVLERLAWMGFETDSVRNEAPNDGPRVISVDDSRIAGVIPTNEELAIARACRDALGSAV